MPAVRQVLHIRTGERAAAETLDGWLASHGCAITACGDVYEACVRLVRHTGEPPELVLLGADWLSPDEFAILRYLRETWPRAGVLVYTRGRTLPPLDFLPLVATCRTDEQWRRVLDALPETVLARLFADEAVLAQRTAAPAPAAPAPAPPPDMPAPRPGHPAAHLPAAPRPTLSAEELAALLNQSGEG